MRELIRGRLSAALRLDGPKLSIVEAKAKPKEPKKATQAPDLSRQLHEITTLRVERIEVFDGEILFREGVGPRAQQLWIHDLELAAQNLATRESLAGGRPITLNAHGQIAGSGDLNVFVSADPFAKPLSFAGQVSVTGLKAAELYEFIEPKTDLKAEKGTIDVFAEFTSRWSIGRSPVARTNEKRWSAVRSTPFRLSFRLSRPVSRGPVAP